MPPSPSSSAPKSKDPEGSDGARNSASGAVSEEPMSDDPIFYQNDPQSSNPSKKGAQLVWQFFLFPLLIVGIAVGLFVLFGALGSSQKSPAELLEDVLQGGENVQKQAGQQLAILISKERSRVDQEIADGTYKSSVESPPAFYESAPFREGLLRAYELARKEEGEERQEMLARALGRAQITESIPVLLGTIYPADRVSEASQTVRRSAAAGIMFMEHRATESALVKMAKEKTDPEIRTMAYAGLTMLGLERVAGRDGESQDVLRALREGLQDANAGVRLNAAYGLAYRQDGSGIEWIRRSLSRKSLAELKLNEEMVTPALANGIRAAGFLGDESLRPLVVRLTLDEHEPEDKVRALARRVLKSWRKQ